MNTKKLVTAALLAVGISLTCLAQSCSASQKATEAEELRCVGDEWATVKAELDSDDPTDVKVVKIAPEVWRCASILWASRSAPLDAPPASEKQ